MSEIDNKKTPTRIWIGEKSPVGKDKKEEPSEETSKIPAIDRETKSTVSASPFGAKVAKFLKDVENGDIEAVRQFVKENGYKEGAEPIYEENKGVLASRKKQFALYAENKNVDLENLGEEKQRELRKEMENSEAHPLKALEIAAAKGNLEMAKALLPRATAGRPIYFGKKYGSRAVKIAFEKNHPEIARLILIERSGAGALFSYIDDCRKLAESNEKLTQVLKDFDARQRKNLDSWGL